MGKIKIFEAFAGYGSQYLGLKKVYEEGCVSVGISEVDVDVIISNAIIHHFDKFNTLLAETWDEKRMTVAREWLRARNIAFDFDKGKSKLDRMKKEKLKQLAIASKLTKNYGDISICNGVKLNEEIDLFTYSSPCQSFSIAGKLEGLKGTSGLLLECEKFIRINKPKVLMLENVKNLVGKQFKGDFDNWCDILTSLGYTNYWQVINAKDYGVPQNRERVFLVSVLSEGSKYEFPQKQHLKYRLKDILEDTVEEKYYLKSTKALQLVKDLSSRFEIGKKECCDMSLKNPKIREISNCIMARYDSGVTNKQAEGIAVIEPFICASRGRNPNNPSDRTVGSPTEQRLEPNLQSVSNALTTVQKDNYVIEPPTIMKIDIPQTVKVRVHNINTVELCQFLRDCRKVPIQQIADTLNVPKTKVEHWFRLDSSFAIPDAEIWHQLKDVLDIKTDKYDSAITEFETRDGVYEKSERTYLVDGISPTLTVANADEKILTSDYRLRKLTPKECWRLMGVEDIYTDRVSMYQSNSAMYKQAGNSIVVNVVEAIFRQLKDCGIL